jgi:hypothetical protein
MCASMHLVTWLAFKIFKLFKVFSKKYIELAWQYESEKYITQFDTKSSFGT